MLELYGEKTELHWGPKLVDTDKLTVKFIWKCKGTRIAKTIQKGRRKMGRICLPKFKTYIAIAVKAVYYLLYSWMT